MDLLGIKSSLSSIPDPRRSWGNKRHKLEDILLIGLCSVICCGEDYVDMEEFGKDRELWLRGFLDLPHGIPDSDTFRRVFERIEPLVLAEVLNNWRGETLISGGRSVNIDGKTIRGSGNGTHKAYDAVSAWVGENAITLGELAVEEKHNEITAIPKLLELIDISGDIVTIDAMGCQTDIAAKIREKEADYVLALKDNHGNLHDDVKEYFDWVEREHPKDEIVSHWKSGLEQGHGRIETREITTASSDWLEGKEKWKDIKTVIRYRCTRETDGKKNGI